MSSSIQVYQLRSNPYGGHRIITTVQSATLISKELFLFNQSDDTFTHVCTVTDLSYPTTADGIAPYYRKDSVTQDFTEVATAIEAATDIKDRLQLVVSAYTEDAASFAGSEVTTITG
jgi:hypothetical protein